MICCDARPHTNTRTPASQVSTRRHADGRASPHCDRLARTHGTSPRHKPGTTLTAAEAPHVCLRAPASHRTAHATRQAAGGKICAARDAFIAHE